MSNLDLFCFDVLGDWVDPKDISISHNRKEVRIPWPRTCPKELVPAIHSDWDHAIKGTEFADVKLTIYVPDGD